jgi:hypothetical protein
MTRQLTSAVRLTRSVRRTGGFVLTSNPEVDSQRGRHAWITSGLPTIRPLERVFKRDNASHFVFGLGHTKDCS